MDDVEFAAFLAIGLGVGGYLFGLALASQLRTLAYELLAHPKLTQILALGNKVTGGGGKMKLADLGMGVLSRWLGGFIGGPPQGPPPQG